MTKTKKLFLILLASILCAALVACMTLLFPARSGNRIAHADEQTSGMTDAAKSAHDEAFGDSGHQGTQLTGSGAKELNEGKYYLNSNFTGHLTVTGTVTLCLNGHTLTGDAEKVITVNDGASLTLYDEGSGVITGSSDSYGVYAEGSFNMNGGTIKNLKYGIYTKATTSGMTSGKITGCETGLYIGGGSYTMSGCEITGNNVGVYSGFTFKISGDIKIQNNDESNVFIRSGKFITINGELEDDALLGITFEDGAGVITSGLSNKGKLGNFFSDNTDAYIISLNNDGEVTLIKTEKQAAKDTLEDYADLKKGEIDEIFPDDPENKQYKDKIDEEVEKGKTAIDSSSDNIAGALKDAEDAIDAIVKEAEDAAAAQTPDNPGGNTGDDDNDNPGGNTGGGTTGGGTQTPGGNTGDDDNNNSGGGTTGGGTQTPGGNTGDNDNNNQGGGSTGGNGDGTTQTPGGNNDNTGDSNKTDKTEENLWIDAFLYVAGGLLIILVSELVILAWQIARMKGGKA